MTYSSSSIPCTSRQHQFRPTLEVVQNRQPNLTGSRPTFFFTESPGISVNEIGRFLSHQAISGDLNQRATATFNTPRAQHMLHIITRNHSLSTPHCIRTSYPRPTTTKYVCPESRPTVLPVDRMFAREHSLWECQSAAVGLVRDGGQEDVLNLDLASFDISSSIYSS